jgi:hypothetical protein
MFRADEGHYERSFGDYSLKARLQIKPNGSKHDLFANFLPLVCRKSRKLKYEAEK